ncbi:MAG: histidine triad nucleotide-binding protein [Calditrichia bacterium]
MSDCIFCKIAGGKQPARIIFQDNEVVAFHDINPQAPVHILIIPRQHIERVSDMEENQQMLMGKLIFTAKQIAKQLELDKTGFRLVFNNGRAGGQQVFHVHLHLLGGRPMRWPPG